LASRNILISGAAGTAGAALARHLSASCTLQLLGRPGGTSPNADHGTVHQVDVESPEQLAQLSAATGPLDALIHTVGAFHHGPLSEVTASDWRALLANNLDSAFFITRAFRENLRAGHGGRIVLFGLPAAETARAEVNITPYFIAKMGLSALAKSLAAEEAQHGVTCNIIAPGFLSNDAASQRRFAAHSRTVDNSELCAAVDFFLAQSSAQVTGTTLSLSGGFRL
jgi:3-oxoacyl-[acyl-carrier protein] reductase